jgi:pimeloyl-ACP methyl ester carboxylesterase
MHKSFHMSIVKVNNSKIRYDQYGEDKSKHILFIHGLGASSIAWRDIPQALSEHFHTIAVDLIGFGGSDKPETADYTIKGFSKFIFDFITKKEIGIERNEKITIVGHSLGGYIAAEVAIGNKDLIEKLVLIDSSGMLNEPTPLLLLYRDAAMETDPILRYKKVQRVFEDLLADRSRLLPVAIDIFIGIIGKEGSKHAFKTAFDYSTSTPIGLDRIKQIEDIPCLIIWGEQDNLIPLNHANEFRKVFRKKIDKLEIIKDAGHAPFVEKSALVYEKLRTFLIQ